MKLEIGEVFILLIMYWMYFWVLLQLMFWLTKKFNKIGLIIGMMLQAVPVWFVLCTLFL